MAPFIHITDYDSLKNWLEHIDRSNTSRLQSNLRALSEFATKVSSTKLDARRTKKLPASLRGRSSITRLWSTYQKTSLETGLDQGSIQNVRVHMMPTDDCRALMREHAAKWVKHLQYYSKQDAASILNTIFLKVRNFPPSWRHEILESCQTSLQLPYDYHMHLCVKHQTVLDYFDNTFCAKYAEYVAKSSTWTDQTAPLQYYCAPGIKPDIQQAVDTYLRPFCPDSGVRHVLLEW